MSSSGRGSVSSFRGDVPVAGPAISSCVVFNHESDSDLDLIGNEPDEGSESLSLSREDELPRL